MFSIRKAGEGDAAGILDCLRSSFEPYRESYTREGFADTVLSAETIGGRLSEMTVFVAVSGSGEVIGTISCATAGEEEGHIRGMAVLPAWQGRGVAAELLRAAEAELRARQPRHDRAPETRDPLLREEWVSRVRQGRRFLRHASLRIRQAIQAVEARVKSAGDRPPASGTCSSRPTRQ